jgi:hypothetical protein
MAFDHEDSFNTLRILSLDLLETYEYLQVDRHSQPARRTWVRTFCSQFEAITYGLKQLLADIAVFPYVDITSYEILVLREESVEVDDKGRVKIKTNNFLSPKKNLIFIATLVARALNSTLRLDTGVHGWEALTTTFAIRNRLVHPKQATDLIVSDDELGTVAVAQDWFQRTYMQLVTSISAALNAKGKINS